MTILACDDEPLMLNLLESAIKEIISDAQIICFSSGQELLNYSAINSAEIAFLDIKMGDSNGLDVARKLMEILPRINIIFVTGYSEFTGDAMEMFASGYINKPVDAAQIKVQMAHLRYPIEEPKRYYAQTFGNFTLFADGKPFVFPREKCKECFALLVDRNGAEVTRKELALTVFEDDTYSRETQRYMSNILKFLVDSLTDAGMGDLVIHSARGYSINKRILESDLFEYLSGNNQSRYTGEYMEQYSWGEYFKGHIM